MEFCILGPLEMRRDGRSVALRGRIVPRLLAALLLEADRAVPLPKLMSAVWQDDPPSSARKQLQNAVSILRGLLSPSDGARLDSVGEGYRLRVGGESQLDALRFHAEVRRARADIDAGEPEAALARLRAGLALWRGPALPGMSGRVLESGANRLEEARLAAIEERVDLELALTEDDTAVAELRELLASHPYRQRLVGQLMMALYRQGRVGEALGSYEAFRRRLADDLGIDPAQPLRELHAAILREDPELSVPPPRRTSAAPQDHTSAAPVPAQLPGRAKEFTGRDQELSVMDELMSEVDSHAVAVSITGIGGVGKTALALHWAHRVVSSFPDGQLYVNLHGFDHGDPVSPRRALSGLLRSLGVAGGTIPPSLDEAAGMLRSLLAGKRVLIVLDNARDTEQVRPLLPGTAGSITIVTSRNRLAGLVALNSALPLPLEALSRRDSRELLGGLLSARRLSADPAATQRLIGACAGLPLALRIAAANLLSNPGTDISSYVAEIGNSGPLAQLAVAGDPQAAVAATFEHSCRALDPDTRRFFLDLGMIPGEDFSGALATMASGKSPDTARRLLDRLTDAHLLEQHRPGRYRLHDLLRRFTRQRAATEPAQPAPETMARRAMDCYAATVRGAFDVYTSGWLGTRQRMLPRLSCPGMALASKEQARAWVETELANLITVVSEAVAQHRDELAVGIAVLLGPVLRTMGYSRQQQTVGEIALPAARRLADDRGLYLVRHDLASVQRTLGHLTQALANCEQDVELTRRMGDPGLESMSLSLLGEIHRKLGDLDAAERHARAALALRAKHGEGLDEAVGYMRLGLIHVGAARYDAAVEANRHALSIARETGDEWNEAAALGNIGGSLQRSGRASEAAGYFERSLELVEQEHLKPTVLAADQHWGYAEALHALGEPGRARHHWDIAADILRQARLITTAQRADIAENPHPDMPAALAD